VDGTVGAARNPRLDFREKRKREEVLWANGGLGEDPRPLSDGGVMVGEF
jgi:hypothetical protein